LRDATAFDAGQGQSLKKIKEIPSKGVGIMKRIVLTVSALSLMAVLEIPANAQQYKMQTPIPPGIASPDIVETRIGTLKFFDGFPDKATVEKLYDNLDFQRAVQAYLLALPPVSQAANRNAILTLGPANTTVPIFEQLMNSRSIFLTANTNTVYSWMWIDLRNGCRFRKLHPPEWRLFPNQNMIPFDDRNCLPFRPHGVRLLQVATAA
jgi:hypothetical protein